jgi:hypothetical protein
MKLEDNGKRTNTIPVTILKLKWKKYMFMAWIKVTNGSENKSSFVLIRHHNS